MSATRVNEQGGNAALLGQEANSLGTRGWGWTMETRQCDLRS